MLETLVVISAGSIILGFALYGMIKAIELLESTKGTNEVAGISLPALRMPIEPEEIRLIWDVLKGVDERIKNLEKKKKKK